MRSFFTFVLRMNQCLNLIAHQVEPRILDNKDGNKANQTPDEGIHWENVDLFTDAVVSEVDETFDAEHQY